MNTLAVLGYPLLLISATEAALGFLLLRQNRGREPATFAAAGIAFYSAWYALLAGLVYVLAARGIHADFLYRSCWVAWLVMPAILQFLYHMRGAQRTARIVGWALYPLFLAALGLSLFTDLADRGYQSLVPFVDRAGPLENPFRVLFGLLMIWPVVLSLRIRRELKGRKRAQVNYFLLGLSIYAVGGFVGGVVFQLFGGLGFDPALAAYFGLPWVALTFYTITRWRLFDVQIVISRTFATFSLFALVCLVHVSMFWLLKGYTGPTLAVLISLVLLFLLVFGTPLRRVIFQAMDRVFVGNKFEYQQILKDSTRAMITILDLEELLKYITDVIKKSLQVEEVCLFTKADDEEFRLRYGPAVQEAVGPDFALRNGAISWIKQTGRTLIREEHERNRPEGTFSASKDLRAIGAELVIPMFFKGEMKGASTLGSKGGRESYVESDIELLEALAGQAAIALENARLYEEAVRDSLTGLHHHQYFHTRLTEEVERSRRYTHPLALLMIDIDRFKQVNDEHGHTAGDRILKQVAHMLMDSARLGDIVARYGGDEFAILLPETGMQKASEVANRIRREIEQLESDPAVTISVGVASTESCDSASELVELADAALYRAKENGRNRVEQAASRT